MKIEQRKTVYDDLNKYCICAKDHDYIEITEWTNGEGWDVDINGERKISLTHGELEAIQFLVKYLETQE